MAIETLNDILEEIADKCEVYGNPQRNEFIIDLEDRIIEAVETEKKLNS